MDIEKIFYVVLGVFLVSIKVQEVMKVLVTI